MLPPRGTGVPFLDLHWKIRRHIYHFAGLKRSCPIALIGSPKCLNQEGAQGTLPTGLFLVCRHTPFESLQYFFCENRFMIVGNHPSDLDAIQRLPRYQLDSLRFLEVHLNPWRDDRNHNDNICLVHGKYGFYGCKEDPPLERFLESITVADFSMIWALDRFCTYLTGIFSHDIVHLTCFCNAESPDIAARIYKSIEQMGRWHTWVLKLNIQPSLPLGSPTRSIVEKRTQAAFPFFKLPADLRFCILGYTDLHPKIGSNPYCEDLFVVNGRLLTSYWGRSGENCPFRTISFPLFLVNKQMKQEAEYVLFSYNCLNFDDGISEALNYLASSPKERLHAISHLRLCFTPEDLRQWVWRTRSAWRMLVRFMRSNLNNSALCLVIDVGEHDIPEHWKARNGDMQFEYEAICELALDLCELNLQDFHLILPQSLRFLEARLEQKVVAPGYDSSRGNRRAKDMITSWSRPSDIAGQRPIRFGRRRKVKGYDEVPVWHAKAWEAITRCYNVADEEHGAECEEMER